MALEGQAKAQELMDENYEIQNKFMEVEDWSKTEGEYGLKALGTGAFVYSYKNTNN